MNLNKMLSKVDDDILGEIIAKCESKMVEPGEGKPFKSKKVAIEIEPEMEDEGMEKSESDSNSMVEKLDSMDEDELLELYSQLKDK